MGPWHEDQWVKRPSGSRARRPGPALERCGRDPLVHETGPDHDVRLAVGGGGRPVPASWSQHHVGPGLGEKKDLIATAASGVDDRRQRLVVDLHQGGRVRTGARGLRHDRHHGLADEADPIQRRGADGASTPG